MSDKKLDRRAFLRAAGGSLVAAGVLGACDTGAPQSATRSLSPARQLFAERFTTPGDGWGSKWLNVRYQGAWSSRDGKGILEVEPAIAKAVQEGKDVAEYMARPVIVRDFEAGDVSIEGSFSVEGAAEAGVVARASYDESYALLVTGREVLLCRYDVVDRTILDRAELSLAPAQEARVKLAVEGGKLAGSVAVGDRRVEVAAADDAPLGSGFFGVLANPASTTEGGRVSFTSFSAASRDDPRGPEPRFAYRFTGAVVADGHLYKARVTARAIVPDKLAFEVSRRDDFSDALKVGPWAPEGRLGSVHVWLEQLDPDTLYHWRPVAFHKGREIAGPPARFRTPAPPGGAVRFAYGCCTSGRVTSYPSFETARSLDPAFYVHSGDWGYAGLTCVAWRADHFQARWMRLLREPNVARLLDQTPLVFWQDDHDYQADNGWAETVEPFTVWSFDELHANPSNDYFDIRWGDVHIWCLDCRLHATDPNAPDDASKSRIGFEQKAWLKQGMLSSDAPVRIVASAMVFRNKPDEDPGWHNVYTSERDELLEFFSDLDATVVILSGDSHGQRLIHHYEFGELYEINSSGTDFEGGDQGNNDPEHTLVNISGRGGFAMVELDEAGPNRTLRVRSIASDDGSTLFEKTLPVS